MPVYDPLPPAPNDYYDTPGEYRVYYAGLPDVQIATTFRKAVIIAQRLHKEMPGEYTEVHGPHDYQLKPYERYTKGELLDQEITLQKEIIGSHGYQWEKANDHLELVRQALAVMEREWRWLPEVKGAKFYPGWVKNER